MKAIYLFVLLVMSSSFNFVNANSPSPGYINMNVKSYLQQDLLKLLRTKGCKVYITGNDANAQIHLKRELEFYDVWEIKLNKNEADYELKLLTNKTGIANADREVRLVITDLKTQNEVYSSPVVRGTDYGFRTVNLKEAAIKNLVKNEIRTKFFQ